MTATKPGMRIAAVLLLALIFIGVFSVTLVSAASGSSSVGGGQWSWSYVSGVYAKSSYYHPSLYHSASARVGTGNVKCVYATAGNTAIATAYGVGTAQVWWNTYQ